MPRVRPCSPYFSGPVPWRARWPLSRVVRYLATFTIGMIAGAGLTAAGLKESRSDARVLPVAATISGVQTAATDSCIKQVTRVDREQKKVANALANCGMSLSGSHGEDPDLGNHDHRTLTAGLGLEHSSQLRSSRTP